MVHDSSHGNCNGKREVGVESNSAWLSRMSKLVHERAVETKSRDKFMRRERVQGGIHFLSSVYHKQD